MSAKMNLIDRAVATVAPRVAARRMAARAALGQMDAMFGRKYEGAARGRGTQGWVASNTAADTEIAGAADLLRARSRDLVRNNAHASKAVQVLVSNIVGYGIRPRAATGNAAFDQQVDNLWQQWSARCDADGHTDFHGLLSLAVREMIEGGEVFAMRRPRRQRDARVRGLEVPLQVEIREADHLDGSKSSLTPAQNAIKQGIEFDQRGRRLAYWMFPEHPGDMTPSIRHSLRSVRVRADNVAHLFERQRVQSRGVPWAAPVMKALQDFDEWHNAELVRKKIEACVAAIVSGFEDEDERNLAPTVQDADGNVVEQFEPGMVAYARGAKQVDFNQPSASGGIAEWNRVQLHTIAAGYRVPYELMTGDLSQVNFSSSRVGLNEFRRMVEAVQWQVVIPMFCERVWQWFTEAAWTAGLLPVPEVPVEWGPPRFESVNPLQDAQTDLIEVRAGFATLQQKIAERGYDPAAVLAEHRATADLADELGLVFDSDPRKVARAGVAHSTPPDGEGSSSGDPPGGGN